MYLTEWQRSRIDRAAQAEGITMAEVVRRAIDEYLGDEQDATEALVATFGASPDAYAPSRDTWRRG